MSDNVTSSFPKMGDEGIPHSVLNLSRTSPYTLAVQRPGPKADQDPDVGTKANRSQVEIKNAQGPTAVYTPRAMRPAQNTGFPIETQRNVKLMPSAIGDRDFWAKRAEGPRV